MPTDEEVVATAGEGLNLWRLGGASSVAVPLGSIEIVEEAACRGDGLLAGAVLARGGLRQALPASFHQARPGVLTRHAAKLAEQEAEQPVAVQGNAVVDDAASLQELLSQEKPKSEPPAAFEELQQIAPSDSDVLVALEPQKGCRPAGAADGCGL